MQYELIYDDYLQAFNSKVNDKLKDGWELHGHTFTEQFNGAVRYFQAVIKKPSRIPSGMQNL